MDQETQRLQTTWMQEHQEIETERREEARMTEDRLAEDLEKQLSGQH